MEIPAITEARRVRSSRLATRVLFAGPEDGVPVVFVHGNFSAATWWEETMLRLPRGFRAIAPDLRGYGNSDPAARVDATRGMGDFSDDIVALMDALSLPAAHLVGHSLGGAVLWRLLADHPDRVLSLTQVNPASPFGFGGTRADGSLASASAAGTGAAAVNPEFARLLAAKDRGDATPYHPRNVLNALVWSPPFVPARIEDILTSSLEQQTGPEAYPGDLVTVQDWPGLGPGRWGPINALSPLHLAEPLAFLKADPKPPILWVRGTRDVIVSDTSLFDLGHLGRIGALPNWPGEEIAPPQPMVAQTARSLSAYREAGGSVTEAVLDCGHTPYLERPGEFDAALHPHLSDAAR